MQYKAVILVGGPSKGTRFRPLSLHIPKPLFPVGGHPLLYHHIQACASLGKDLVEVLLLGFYDLSELSSFIEDTSKHLGVKIRYLQEKKRLGTAGGLLRFQHEIEAGLSENDSIFVIHGDIICRFPLEDLVECHSQHSDAVGTMMATKVDSSVAGRYGCIATNPETQEVVHYAEKPETFVSNIVNCGVYLFRRSLFFSINAAAQPGEAVTPRAIELSESGGMHCVSDESPDRQIRLEQDVLVRLAEEHKLFCLETDNWWISLKHPASALLASANALRDYRTSHPERLSKSGEGNPTIVGEVLISPSAKVHPSAKIGPNVTIGDNVVIGAGVRVRHSILLPGTIVKPRSCIMHSIIGWDSIIGAWSRIEGIPDKPHNQQVGGATILGTGVSVAAELIVRGCIVLDHKGLSSNQYNSILL